MSSGSILLSGGGLVHQLELSFLLLLGVIGFLAGIGITAIGPGGIFVTIALALTPAPPAVVAGTAGATNIAAGLVGTGMYNRSGELSTAEGERLVLVLSPTSAMGAVLGKRVNDIVSGKQFMLILGGTLVIIGVLIWFRERYGTGYRAIEVRSRLGSCLIALIGIAVGVPSGLLGIGGPVLAVPLLVMLGVPLLIAVAAAQVQSVFISGTATVAYFLDGSVSIPLVLLIGIPELFGIIIGWKVGQVIDPTRLKLALTIVLVFLGVYIAL